MFNTVPSQAIRAGQFLIEYVGELIDDKEVERRLWEAKRSNEPNFYMMEIGPDVTIDARYKGSIARLLNSVRPLLDFKDC